jgi:GNAT superfamily N-acetyltransferase
MLREWDPSTASSADLDSIVETMNAVRVTDLPGDPLWCSNKVREYFQVTLPGERRVTWFAESREPSGQTRLLGHATLLITQDIGVLELLVRPDSRGRGVGTRLLAAVARRAAQEGIQSIGLEVVGGTPSVPFFERHGFRRAYTELRSVLDLATVDWHELKRMASGIGAGYRVEFHAGGPPLEMYQAYAEAKASIRQLPPEDLELRPSSYDPERLAASVHTLRSRGLTAYIVVAVQERTEMVAGLTEVVIPAQCPARADQYDTIVVPQHRSYGIDRAIRARMLIELRAAEPTLVDVQTWNALDNAQMAKINSELGFREDREWREYDVEVPALLGRLERVRSAEAIAPRGVPSRSG